MKYIKLLKKRIKLKHIRAKLKEHILRIFVVNLSIVQQVKTHVDTKLCQSNQLRIHSNKIKERPGKNE